MVEGDIPPSAFEALTQDAALADMERKSGLTLSWACPVSRNYQRMVVVLDNRNILRDHIRPRSLGGASRC